MAVAGAAPHEDGALQARPAPAEVGTSAPAVAAAGARTVRTNPRKSPFAAATAGPGPESLKNHVAPPSGTIAPIIPLPACAPSPASSTRVILRPFASMR